MRATTDQACENMFLTELVINPALLNLKLLITPYGGTEYEIPLTISEYLVFYTNGDASDIIIPATVFNRNNNQTVIKKGVYRIKLYYEIPSTETIKIGFTLSTCLVADCDLACDIVGSMDPDKAALYYALVNSNCTDCDCTKTANLYNYLTLSPDDCKC